VKGILDPREAVVEEGDKRILPLGVNLLSVANINDKHNQVLAVDLVDRSVISHANSPAFTTDELLTAVWPGLSCEFPNGISHTKVVWLREALKRFLRPAQDLNRVRHR